MKNIILLIALFLSTSLSAATNDGSGGTPEQISIYCSAYAKAVNDGSGGKATNDGSGGKATNDGSGGKEYMDYLSCLYLNK